jgi:hypothetical protein
MVACLFLLSALVALGAGTSDVPIASWLGAINPALQKYAGEIAAR